MATPVRITLSDLTEKVEAGWKKDALAEHYGLPITQMTKALQQAGLRIRKFHRPKFELVGLEETEVTTGEVVPVEALQTHEEFIEDLAQIEEMERTEGASQAASVTSNDW